MLIKYADWKQEFLAEIEALSHTTAKGDVFVQKVLQIYYNLSEGDAIDATVCPVSLNNILRKLFIVNMKLDEA